MRARAPIVILLLIACTAEPRAQRISLPVPRAATRDSSDPRDARIDRLEQWMKASARHVAGESDAAAALVGGWPEDDLRQLWMDSSVLIALMHRSLLSRFIVKGDVLTDSEHVKYTEAQTRRLRALACAATGKATWASLFTDIVTDPVCTSVLFELDGELRQLSARAAASKRDGDENFFVRRAAMLHADIAVAPPERESTSLTAGYKVQTSAGPQQIRLDLSDGRGTGLHAVPIHWIIGRTMLDDVRPPGAGKAAPGRDAMVREWYRVSAAWMQQKEDYDTRHLDHALQFFPDDPDLLFLAGCQHETFASPAVQHATQFAEVPSGFMIDVRAYVVELEQAATFFRRSLAHGPDLPERHLRLGHVLLLQGRYEEAARHLRGAVARLEDDHELLYDGELFLGAAEERLRNDEAARLAYERAAALYPTAQSPLLGLSQVARRRGDRAAALGYIERLFALPLPEAERVDPWWTYHHAQARNAGQLLEDLRRPFRASMTP